MCDVPMVAPGTDQGRMTLRDTKNKTLVLFVGGEGRSGSTVLSALVGQHQGFCSVGELHGIWQAVLTNELCSCGRPFRDCPFWSSVGANAFGQWDAVDVSRMLSFDTQFTRHRYIHRVMASTVANRRRHDMVAYLRILTSLYQTVREVSGCDVIVDSSKDPPYAFLLRQSKQLEIRLVHLVRDSRGVAYSWGKARVARPEYTGHPTLAGTFMNTRRPWRSAVEWDVKNLLFECLGKTGTPRILVRYESLASAPETTIRRIVDYASTGSLSMHPEAEGPPSLCHHMLGGNRVRFNRGIGPIRLDEEWRHQMKFGRRAVVTALSAPFLARYGYLGSR
jgi:Sulfotransferase family